MSDETTTNVKFLLELKSLHRLDKTLLGFILKYRQNLQHKCECSVKSAIHKVSQSVANAKIVSAIISTIKLHPSDAHDHPKRSENFSQKSLPHHTVYGDFPTTHLSSKDT